MGEYTAFEGQLEIRQVGGARLLSGTSHYNSVATTNDRGRVRKESFASRAFRFAIEDENRKIDLLVGHDFGKPIASRQSGTLSIVDSDAVRFEATLPEEALTPSWVLDVEKAILNGTMIGLSPGFRVPPMSAVPNAERLIPEPGNPGVQIRQINDAVLREFSVVTAGIYERHQGKDLQYLTVVPDNHAPEVNYPLVIMLHGFGANMQDLAGLAPAIESEGYVYACPNAPIPFNLGLGQEAAGVTGGAGVSGVPGSLRGLRLQHGPMGRLSGGLSPGSMAAGLIRCAITVGAAGGS